MKTLKKVLYFVFDAIDLPTETARTWQKYIPAHECLKIYLQSAIVSDDIIKEAQNRIDKYFTLKTTKKII